VNVTGNVHICQSPLATQECHNVFSFLCEFKFILIIKVWTSLLLSPLWEWVMAFQVMKELAVLTVTVSKGWGCNKMPLST